MTQQLNLSLEKNKKKLDLKNSEGKEELPEYKTHLELSPEEEKRIVDEILAELEEIDKGYQEKKLDDLWDSLDRQYDGEMAEIEGMQFNLSTRTTAIKVNAITQALMDAFFDGERVFSITARPEFDKKGGQDILDQQEDFLDYKIDEVIPLEEECEPVFHSAVLKGCGILKFCLRTEIRKRKMDEYYPGVKIEDGKVVDDSGLKTLLQNHPDAAKQFPKDVEALMNGKDLSLTVEYDEVVYDDPLPRFIDLKDFRVRLLTNKLEGLRDTLLIAERKKYTYWELKLEEKRENLKDIDRLIYDYKKDGEGKLVKEEKPIEKFANKEYELYVCTFFTRIKATDTDEADSYIKCVFHINKEKKTMHDAVFFPYYTIDTNYIPFYIKRKKNGFYEDGVGKDLTSINLTENIILNTALEGAYIANLVTPIVKKDSNLAQQFISKTWVHGMPLEIETGEKPDFLSNYMKQQDTRGQLALKQFMRQEGAEISGVAESFATGKADPIDPQAPAAKTMALLERSGLNIKQFIKRILPSMNEAANVIMQMYFQKFQSTPKKEMKYRVNPERVKEGEAFKAMTREQMSAKTNAQSQALGFDFNKQNQKRELLAFWQVFRSDPVLARNPWAVYQLGKFLINNWSYSLRNKSGQLWPSPDEYQKQITQVSMQAIQGVIGQEMAKAKLTGKEPDISIQKLMAVVQQALADFATPPDEKEIKKREDQQVEASSVQA